MRLATFNLESLDLPPKAAWPIAARAEVLRPALARLDADILCLQEVNGQHVPGRPERVLAALDQLLDGTAYATYHRAATTAADHHGAADVHNLVTLSRTPISAWREVRHDYLQPLQWPSLTSEPPGSALAQRFERPLLLTDIDLGNGRHLSVVNLHLRAPIAAAVPGQKASAHVWKSIPGWAEGYYLAALKRAGQALELRLLVDSLLQADPHCLVALAGDFNAEDHETPLRLAVAAQEDTGNGALEARSLVVLDRALPADRRWSVLHHGRPQMLDHILASRALCASFRAIEVHNEGLGDEAVGFARVDKPPGSYHAGVVAEFNL